MKTIKIILTFYFFTFLKTLNAQPGNLDTTFGTGGKLVKSISLIEDVAYSTVVQADLKTVIAGWVKNGSTTDALVCRLQENGDVDSTFGVNGYFINSFSSGNDKLRYLYLMSSGDLLVAGDCDTMGGTSGLILKLHNNGTLDSSFGVNGINLLTLTQGYNSANQILESNTGSIYVSLNVNNTPSCSMFKFKSNGIIDNIFGVGGARILSPIVKGVGSFIIDSTGMITGGGSAINTGNVYDFALFRLDTLGNMDSSFGSNGIVRTDIANDYESITTLQYQADGKIMAGGGTDFSNGGLNWAFVVARFNNDGSLDSTFNNIGYNITNLGIDYDRPTQIAIQPDGKIIASGYKEFQNTADFALVRYDSTGVLDGTFGNNGIVLTDFQNSLDAAYDMKIQPDLKIIVCGGMFNGTKWSTALARYLSGLNVGVIEFTEEKLPLLVYPNPVSTYANINYTLTAEENLSMKLYDVKGHEIKSFMEGVKKQKGEQTEYLYFGDAIQTGVYFLRISNGNGEQVIKIIKN